MKILGILLSLLFLSACVARKGEINGVLCYPSDYVPSMNVYLKETHSQKIYKLTTNQDQRRFKFRNIPFGDYTAYAYTLDKVSMDRKGAQSQAKGGYTKAVACGLTIHCHDHSLIKIKIKSRRYKDTISICDFYGAIVPTEPKGTLQITQTTK